jgi:hypothetical protein
VRRSGYKEIVFADDLNAYKEYCSVVPDDEIFADMTHCQTDLHAWRAQNRVAFDPAKESKHILGTAGRGSGGSFAMLGVSFDSGLTMSDELSNLTQSVKWKTGALLRTRRFVPSQLSSRFINRES